MASMVSRHLTSADKGRVFGVSLAGSHFGSVVAGAIGSILLEWFGWRSLFQFVGKAPPPSITAFIFRSYKLHLVSLFQKTERRNNVAAKKCCNRFCKLIASNK